MTQVIVVDLLVDLGTIGRLVRDRENGFVRHISSNGYIPTKVVVSLGPQMFLTN